MYIKLVIFLALFFAGCSIQPKTTYLEYKQIQKKSVSFQTKTKENNNGIIKGIVEKVVLGENNIWQYEIRGVDMSNAKLDFVKATYFRKIANKGTLIYATIRNSVIKEYFILKGSKVPIVKNNEKVHKRTKKRQILAVPQSETILLD